MPPSDTLNHPDASSELSPSGPYRAYKQLGLVLLCAIWILLGLLGHDPWKSDDAVSFGSAYDMLKSGDWIIPHVAGVATPERPPLFYAVAAAFAWAFGGVFALHDAARLAVALCLASTLWLLAMTGRELYGRAFRWMPVLLFIGCVGLWDRAHLLGADLGVLPAAALALYALALALRRPALGGVLLGLATGLAFLCRGSVAAALIMVTALVLPLFGSWRAARYGGTLALAVAVAIPLVAVWPLALYWRSPELFAEWYRAQGLARFFGHSEEAAAFELLYYVKNLLWFAWPALPLAAWSLWVRARGFNGRLNAPGIVLPLVAFAVVLLALSGATEPRPNLAMPLLLPLALLGAAEIDSLKRGYSGALDWFGILTFGLLAVVLWGLWFESLRQGLPEDVARLLRDTQPGYQPPWQLHAVLVSAGLTLLWLALVRPARRSNRRAVLNWAAGMTLIWGLSGTLWLPYIDSRRSYRPVAESLAAHLPPPGTCVASRNLGEAQRALLEYLGNVVTVRDEVQPNNNCTALLVQLGRDDSDAPPDPAWVRVWEGRRRGDDTERFILFTRAAASPPRAP
jgi:4-amino-4-deoxy-L-arabinose transferase-like glycosyltransferase